MTNYTNNKIVRIGKLFCKEGSVRALAAPMPQARVPSWLIQKEAFA
jgi:hypothetical protein